MEKLNNVLQELGISKVKLAKYLGVSRQMVYNYLELENINKWPKEKKILLLKLLDIEDGEESTIGNIKVTTDYLLAVESRLNDGIKEATENDYLDLKGLKKEEHSLISDITFLIKEKLTEQENHDENFHALHYLYHMLQCMDYNPEIKYFLAYLSKSCGYTAPNLFVFNEEKQYIFEGIIYHALTLYNSGSASKSKVTETRNRFLKDIESRKEEKLSHTQQLNVAKVQALRELGYTEITSENAAEILDKIAEITTSRKV